MEVKIKTDMDKQIKRMLKKLPRQAVIQPAIASMNRAARDGKRAGIKRVVSNTGIRAMAIRGSRSKNIKARITGASGSARASKKRMSAMVFVKTDVDIKYSKAFNKGSLKKITTLDRKSFFATMPDSGKKSRWYRTGQPKRRVSKGRYAGTQIKREPIAEVGIPIKDQTKPAQMAIEKKALDVLPKEFVRLSQLALNKLARR